MKTVSISKDKGITLVSLVVTIIILLILSSISIVLLTGNKGIIMRASTSEEESRGAKVEELKELWKANKRIDKYSEVNELEPLSNLLDNLEKQKLITQLERKEIDETGKVKIGSRTIIFGKGIIIDLVELEEKTTNTIKIKAKATGNINLSYSLYTKKEGENDWILGQTIENKNSGEEVLLIAENLSSYSYYNWYVDITDGEDTFSYESEEKIRTYCPSGLDTCTGPFPQQVECTTCHRK